MATSSLRTGSLSGSTRLLLVSILGLFLELILIRWIGTEIRIFAYLQNTILVVCFLGFAVGCMTADQPASLRDHLKFLLLFLLLMTIPASRRLFAASGEMLGALNDFVIWAPFETNTPGELLRFVGLGLATTLMLLALLVEIFVPLGRLLGRLMDDHPRPIVAYSINIGGSLLGIWLLVGLSSASLPPPVWFLLCCALLLPLILEERTGRRLNVCLLAGCAALGVVASSDRGALETTWSPYQKLVLKAADPAAGQFGAYHISVNNSDFQEIIDLSRETTRQQPEHFPREGEELNQYELPYRLHPGAERALIVGAGSGNDVAGALRQRIPAITAVEIDPVIIDFGRRFHPERPYAAANVSVVTDDARSFFATTAETYDVISFGLLDSHTMTSMTNARLDHYVYTRESIEQVQRLLKPGGIVTLNFYAAREFIGDRIATTLKEVFGADPLVFRIPVTPWGRGGVMFVAGDPATIATSLHRDPALRGAIDRWQAMLPMQITHTTPGTTDDWPYLYLERPAVPTLFFLLAGLIVILCLHVRHRFGLRDLSTSWGASHSHFFFLGAAFLLLEVQNISKAAVVLGNSWVVNAVIISGILAMILLANLTAARFRNLSTGGVYLGLFGVCLALYWIDLASFAFLPFPAKALLVGTFTALPMYFSGLIFIDSFSRCSRRDTALGANFAGSIAGALLQSLSFVFGMKSLLMLVVAFYALAWLSGIRLRRPHGVAAHPSPEGRSAALT